ncbi:MAG: SRPBCC family protein [Nitrospiraceae bacterium]
MGGLLYHGVEGRSSLYRLLGIDTVRTTRGTQLIEVVKTMTINRPQEEVYKFWRNFENLPRFMRHLKSVEVIDDKRSRWTAVAPAGASVTWEAEIVNEKPHELIAWQSTDRADVSNWGVVRFAPAPHGKRTEIRVELEYEPLAGTVGVAVAKLFGEEPAQQVEEDLRRFKQIIETGEIATTKGQPRGG